MVVQTPPSNPGGACSNDTIAVAPKTVSTPPSPNALGTAAPSAVMPAAPEEARGGREHEAGGGKRGEGEEEQTPAEPPPGPKPDDSIHVSASQGSGGLNSPASRASVQATTAKEEVAAASGTSGGRIGGEVRNWGLIGHPS